MNNTMTATQTVHIIIQGTMHTWCGRTDHVTEWPDGHEWVCEADAADATCEECRRAAKAATRLCRERPAWSHEAA